MAGANQHTKKKKQKEGMDALRDLLAGKDAGRTGPAELFEFFDGMTAANAKRTYDEYQHESLADIRANRQKADDLHELSVQAMQNAIETANLVGKNATIASNLINTQAVRHGDLSIDRQWNVDEVAAMLTVILKTFAGMASDDDDD